MLSGNCRPLCADTLQNRCEFLDRQRYAHFCFPQALDTLIKCTEDYRDDLVVILAGYSEEMRRLSASNPGVKSRFPTTIE